MKLFTRLCAYIAVAWMLTGCSRGEQWQYVSGSTWGTVYNIKYQGNAELADSIVATMRAVELSLSPFEKQSVVSAINSGTCMEADSMLSEVFDLSQNVCRLSGGAFDPTVAPLINLWGFGYKKGATDAPSQQQIDSALLSVGILDCSIDSAMMVRKKSPDTEFNFSAIAKGYGVDQIANMLDRNGCSAYMVEVGGELALKGNGPSGDMWSIQIDAPVASDEAALHNQLTTMRVTDVGIATSGNYRNYRHTSQGDVGHTISPVTGRPVATSTLSATVIAPTCAFADALATASMAMPLDSALSMLRSLPSVDAIIVISTPDGALKTINLHEERHK